MDNVYALLDGDIVVNRVIWDGGPGWSPPEELTALPCPDQVGIGWRRQGEEWLMPEPSSTQAQPAA